MFKVTLVCVGSLKEKYLREAAAEYEKRLGAYCRISVVELKEEKLPDSPSASEIGAALCSEGERIIASVPQKAFLIALAVEGKSYSSEELAAYLSDLQVKGHGELALVIGSSHGLSEQVKSRADMLLSVSKLTFPHQLMRPLTLEILYRCLSINAGARYHK